MERRDVFSFNSNFGRIFGLFPHNNIHTIFQTVEPFFFIVFGLYQLDGQLVAKYFEPRCKHNCLSSELFREELSFILIPFLLRLGKNPEGLIAVDGATLMDTTLGLFSETLGTTYAINSTINGIIFSVMAPFIVPFLRPFESVSSSNYQIPELIKPILLFA
jgi:hypothetical protein